MRGQRQSIDVHGCREAGRCVRRQSGWPCMKQCETPFRSRIPPIASVDRCDQVLRPSVWEQASGRLEMASFDPHEDCCSNCSSDSSIDGSIDASSTFRHFPTPEHGVKALGLPRIVLERRAFHLRARCAILLAHLIKRGLLSFQFNSRQIKFAKFASQTY